jgi:hypothetical protein
MTLTEYVEKMGPGKVALMLDLSPGTVKAWRWKVRQPSVEKAIELMIKTDGLLTWEDIYGDARQRVEEKIKLEKSIA